MHVEFEKVAPYVASVFDWLYCYVECRLNEPVVDIQPVTVSFGGRKREAKRKEGGRYLSFSAIIAPLIMGGRMRFAYPN